MKSLFTRIVFPAALIMGFAAVAHAQESSAGGGLKIAVLNMSEALLNSDRAKEVDAEVQKETAEDVAKVRNLAQQGQNLQQRLQQDGAVLSDAEKRRLNDQIEEIGVQYQYLTQKLQETLQQRRDQFQQAYAPNLIQAITDVVQEEGYDLILRAEVVLHYENAFDITAKVTEKLNRQEQ